jgi:DNA-directed RNA polymerase specialized sigma24 family protein
VRAALDALAEPLRAVVTLHELEGHTLRETALALGIPFETAKDRLARARTQLRSSLTDATLATERAERQRRGALAGAAIAAGPRG